MNTGNKKVTNMMKFYFLILIFSSSAWSVCDTPITRTNIGFSSVLTSTRYNADVNTAYNRLNNLPGDCVVDSSIITSKIADGAITNSKIANASITSAKLATGAIPEAGRLIRISSFTTSGTWTRQADVGSVLIQVVGGGGASFHASSTNGGASSFGAHCTANGGSKPTTSSNAGIGGTATGGDINLQGGNGASYYSDGYAHFGATRGVSFLGQIGSGGIGSISSPSGGGGAGGYCSKLIARANLNATETVTVGAGGTNPGTNTTPGTAGIVIVYEYSL